MINQAFIKEILALEAEVPEGTEFQTDINENVRSVVYTSLGYCVIISLLVRKLQIYMMRYQRKVLWIIIIMMMVRERYLSKRVDLKI